MSKIGEIEYLAGVGEAGRHHAKHKPWANHDCSLTLCSIGTVMHLMPERPARVLDMGCGSGWTSLFFAKHGYDVVGQDVSPDMIALAEELRSQEWTSGSAEFLVSDYESLSFADAFDCAVFFDCLHHAEDERAALASAYRALRPGGRLITHEPGEGHATAPWSIAAMEQYGVTEKDMPPSRIIALGTDVGFTSARIYPMQETLLEVFFRPRRPKLLSKSGLKLARRVLNLVFNPSEATSSIVVLQK